MAADADSVELWPVDWLWNALAEFEKVEALGVSPSVIPRLHDYIVLLARWNRVYNLCGFPLTLANIMPHIFSSLMLCRHLSGRDLRVLDIGSGNGLLGLVQAICYPDQWSMVGLVDSSHKKVLFLRYAIQSLGLSSSVKAIHSRVEDLSIDGAVDGVEAKAFCSLIDGSRLAWHWLKPGGVYLSLKGPLVVDQEVNAFIAASHGSKFSSPSIFPVRTMNGFVVKIVRST